jgi:hypothetical protein
VRIAVLVDDLRVSRWQAAALERVCGNGKLLVYNCVNTRPGPRRMAHALYYLLNLFTVRNRLTATIQLDEAGLNLARPVDFASEYERMWQRLPGALLDRIRSDAPDVILKFGLSLLRIPDRLELAAPILSYHHGDPREFRGRPAGFYEIGQGAALMGQIVQILSNRLDAGQVVAFAATKVHAHSYRRTLVEAYRHSPLILETAIRNALAGTILDIAPTGRLFRLPTNLTVLRFLLSRLKWTAARLFYGAFVEKGWSVSTALADPEDMIEPARRRRIVKQTGWRTEHTPKGYSFLADPFFHPAADGLLVEALNAATGRGEILHLGPGGPRRLSDPRNHLSYPGSLRWLGEDYIVPEVAEWSAARIFRLADGGLRDVGLLDLPGRLRIVDPTFFVDGKQVYLFGNDLADGGDVLRLWMAGSPFDRFEEHKASPILVSPEGGRMAGAIVRHQESLYRLGQDGRRDYGGGLIIFRIEVLTSDDYRESREGAFQFQSVRGPHTMNFRSGEAVFDWYRHRFSVLAGFRRLLGRLARR